MPELPEVETVARGLQAEIAGRSILSLTVGKSDFIDDLVLLEKELPGRKIRAVERYGKFLLLRLANRERSGAGEEGALLVHLGMTGLLMPRPVNEPQTKHTHVVMQLDDGRELRYTDARRFGRMAYLAGDRLQAELRRFGVDPAGDTARGVHPGDSSAQGTNQGALAGPACVAGRRQHLRGRKLVEGEDPSGAVGGQAERGAVDGTLRSAPGDSAPGDCTARIVDLRFS